MFLSSVLFAITAFVGSIACLPIGKSIEAVDLNYRCLHIVKEGVDVSTKSPVLLIHGLSASLSNWDGISQVLALRTGRRICAVDLRNHGDSPVRERFDVEALTEDIAKFLEKQNIQKVNIIGHSLGGKTGVHFSLKNPDKVDSLVVEDMRPNGVTEQATNLVTNFLKLLQQAIDAIPEGVKEEEAKKRIGDYLNQKMQELGVELTLNDKMIQSFDIRLVNNKWQWKQNMVALINGLLDPEGILTESKGLYEGPTLFIYGTASVFDVGGDKENILKLFPNAKLVPVEGADHLIHEFYPQFEEEVIKFLNSL